MDVASETTPADTGRMPIEVFSDVVCPWCWIGEERLRRAVAELGVGHRVRVRVRSFQLDPEARVEPLPERLSRKFGRELEQLPQMTDPIAALGRELGLELDFENATAAPSHDAHRLIQMAAAHELDFELMSALHRAHFAERADISDPATLRSLATGLGLDGAEVDSVLASDAYADRVAADQQEAQGLGIGGVPFFIFDRRYALNGAQPEELFAQGVEDALATRTDTD